MYYRLFAGVAALAFVTASAAHADTFQINESGITIEGNSGAKVSLSLPVIVSAAKTKAKIAEKTIAEKSATLKYEGGGQLELTVGDGELVCQASNLPTDTRFFHTLARIDMAFGGGKWKLGAEEGALPAEKGDQPLFRQGTAPGFAIANAAGGKIGLILPEYTFQQLQDGRKWNGNYFLWEAWMPYTPGKDRWVIQLGDAPTPPKAAAKAAPAPVPEGPVFEKKAGADNGTQIYKWKDGKRACFMLAFDDSAPSQLKNVVPELDKRKIVGNFFLVTGNSLYANLKPKWEQATKSPYIVAQNHTFTHKGVNNVEELDQELAKCNEVLYALHPERKVPRLLGFGTPGGVPWKVTKEEFEQELAKHHLVNRPPFQGSPMHYTSPEAMIGVVDTALAKAEMGHMDMHGVGGDWLTTPMDWFLPFLDKLEKERDRLWITDTVSWHQYVKERQAAEIKVVENKADGIRLELTCGLDPAFYDLPLTLSTKVPSGWKTCTVTQGKTTAEVEVKDGAVKYDAVPGAGEISLKAK